MYQNLDTKNILWILVESYAFKLLRGVMDTPIPALRGAREVFLVRKELLKRFKLKIWKEKNKCLDD